MAFDLARWIKVSRYCSLEKKFLMCSNSSFRKLGEQILKPLRKETLYECHFLFYRYGSNKLYEVIFVVYRVVNFDFEFIVVDY